MVKILSDEKMDDGLSAESDDMKLWRKLFDVELLGAVVNIDTWLYEESLLARPRGFDTTVHAEDCSAEDSIEGVAVDFRDQIDEKECGCTAEGRCLRCCTFADLYAIPMTLVRRIENIRIEWFEGRPRKVFDLVMV